MSVELNNESGVDVDEGALQRLVTFGLDLLHVHPDADVAVLFVDEAAMEQLHVQWMDEPGPTDVLSFPMDELRSAAPGEEPVVGMLGDIVLCPSFAARQAAEKGRDLDAELRDAVRGPARRLVAEELDAAAARRGQPGEAPHRRRLAGAVAPEHRDDLAFAHVERDAAQDVALAVVGLDGVDDEHRLHSGSPR